MIQGFKSLYVFMNEGFHPKLSNFGLTNFRSIGVVLFELIIGSKVF